MYIINHLKNERYFPPERRKKLLKENHEEIENCKNKLKENDISDSDHIRAEKAIRVLERYNRIFNAIQEGKI